MLELKQQVAQLMEQEPTLLPVEMAEKLNVSEFQIVASLPEEMVTLVAGEQAQMILEKLVGFGPVTTIVHSFGSIFEVKSPFPKGKVARAPSIEKHRREHRRKQHQRAINPHFRHT